jgi:L-asparaginase II
MTAHKSAPQVLVPGARVFRGDGVEAVHAAAIAVVDASSRLTHYLGDPEQAFFARSSIKPFQALPLVVAGGVERFGLDMRELALCAASHSGTELHRGLVLGLLRKLGLGPSALQCGPGASGDALGHNCSGKHAGFLALALALEQPIETYLDPAGQVQRAVRHAVAHTCEVADADALACGTDGCSAPNYSLPLVRLAAGFKNLALAGTGALLRIRAAMQTHPVLVSGEGRLDHDLALAFPERIVAKGGAEGLSLMAFTEPALGIAVKVLDGSPRALGPIVVETLKQLGLIDDVQRFPSLLRHEVPLITNARQLVTGEVRADFELLRA